MVSNHKIQNGR